MKSQEIASSMFFFCFFFSCDTPQKPNRDVNAPYVKIISHQTGNKINQVATIQIQVEDENEISIVEVLLDSIVIAEAKKNDSLFSAHWNTTIFPNGQHVVKAKASDINLNTSISDSIVLEIDNSLSYPQPQNIKSIQYDQTEMVVSWDKSLETDILSYEILISESYNGHKSSFATIYDTMPSPFLVTNNFNPALEKYYWLKVIDSFYYHSIGNGYRVIDDYPRPSLLSPAIEEDSLIFLIWTSNQDSDFISYSLNMSNQQTMENSSILFSSSNRSDTTYSFYRVTSKQFYKIKTQDYWGLETSSNIEILDLGLPPTIVSSNTPDTIKIIELGLDTIFFINATVTDEDGLDNISTVKLKTFFSDPDSIILDTTYYALYDDGNLDSLFYSGDSFRGDGIFSNKIFLDPNINPGIYEWIFTATDLDDRVSENLETTVVIQ